MNNVKVGKLTLEYPLMNASGVYCTTKDELFALGNNNLTTGVIVTKSITKEPREGNPQPRIWASSTQNISINSSGLPNLGHEAYLPILKDLSTQTTKPIICSMAPLNVFDKSMIETYSDQDFIDGFEINYSCPNLCDSNSGVSTPFEYYNKFRTLREIVGNEKHLGCKLPPYFNQDIVEEMADVFNECKLDSITCINSISNGLYIDTSTFRSCIVPKEGHGGLGGCIVKPTALANIHWFYKELKSSCSIIGCGGIESGNDLLEHILCGAKAGQIGTAFWKEKHGVFKRVYDEFTEICKEKNIESIEQICGKVNVIRPETLLSSTTKHAKVTLI